MRTTEEILADIKRAQSPEAIAGLNLVVPIEEKAPEVFIPSGKKNIILDATLMTGIMTCATFADLRYNHSFVQVSGKSNSLEIGSIVHKVLEVFYKGMIQGLKRTDAIGNGLIAGEQYIKGCQFCTDFEPTEEVKKPPCGHPPNEYPGVRNTPAESQTKPSRVGWKHVLVTCEEYFDFYKNDFWIPLEIEVVKRKIIYEDDEIRIMWKAKLDSVFDTNQGIFPVDHKTMQQRRDSLGLNNQFKGQCLVSDTRRMFVNKIGFQTGLKPEEKFTRVPISYSANALLEFQSEIVPMVGYNLLQYSESGYWPMTGHGINCEGKFGNCIFNRVCSADKNLREDELRQDFVIGPKWDIENLEKD